MVWKHIALWCALLPVAPTMRVVPIAVAHGRAIVAIHGMRESIDAYASVPANATVGCVGLLSEPEHHLAAMALLEMPGRPPDEDVIVVRDVVAFDDASGTVLLQALHRAAPERVDVNMASPRWRVAWSYIVADEEEE